MPPYGILVSNMSDMFQPTTAYTVYFSVPPKCLFENISKNIWKRFFFSSTGKDLVLDHLDDYLVCNLIADFSDNHSLFKCQKFHWQLRMRDRKQCALEVTPPSLSVNKGSNWKTNSQLQNTSWVFKASQTYFPKFPKGKKRSRPYLRLLLSHTHR